MPRSGTTLLFEPFAHHPNLGWPSNHSQNYPNLPWLNVLDRLLRNRWLDLAPRKLQYGRKIFGNKFMPYPDEAYDFWDRYSSVDFSRDYLTTTEPSAAAVNRLRHEIQKILRWQGRTRLCAKFTGPSRISFLRYIFPDALFIHIVRDGRAVTHSLLRVPFWSEKGGLTGPFWQNGLPQASIDKWNDEGNDPGILAAIQWSHIVDSTRKSGGELGTESYMEVRYEDFVENPSDCLESMQHFAGLPFSESGTRSLRDGPPVKNMNFKYENDFGADELGRLTSGMRDSLQDFGYL